MEPPSRMYNGLLGMFSAVKLPRLASVDALRCECEGEACDGDAGGVYLLFLPWKVRPLDELEDVASFVQTFVMADSRV